VKQDSTPGELLRTEEPTTVSSGDVPESAGKAPSSVLAHLPDVVLGGLAALLTLPTLLYPFGRDQGLYYYVAREWLYRGSIPYKDVLDHKTPGIYVIHLVAIALFGPHEWSIRVVEALGVLVFGLALGASVSRAGSSLRPGVRGAGMLTAAVFYFGYFDFWNSAQSEIWYAGLGLCGVWAARRIERVRLAAFVAGLFVGLVLVVKPPGATFCLLVAGVFALRLRRENVGRGAVACGALFVAGAVVAPLLVLAYFGATGALPAMKDIVVGANAYYVKHEGGAPGPWIEHILYMFRVFQPFASVLVLASLASLVYAIRNRDFARRENFFIGAGALVCALLSVTVQGKYYVLHWGCLCLGIAFSAVSVFDHALERSKARASVGALGLVAVLSLGYFVTAWFVDPGQRDTLATEVAYLRGKIDLRTFQQRFQVAPIGFWYADSYEVGKWLEQHTSPEESVTVRGFQPEIYAVANRRHRGRFFWTTFLTNPARAYNRELWLAEDAADLKSKPPRYLVALGAIHEGPDSAELYEALGYRRVTTLRGYVIMEPATAKVTPTP
jgi:hypothetical protein